MAGRTPYRAIAYIAVLTAGTPSSSSETGTSPPDFYLRPERKSQRMARKKRRTKGLISDEATEYCASHR